MTLLEISCRGPFKHVCTYIWTNASNNSNADVSIEARGLNFGLSIHLHPYFVCASNKRS